MTRKILIVTASVLGFLLLAALTVPFFVDADKFRPGVETAAQDAIGRKVTLGKLELSVLRGAVVAHDLSVADDPAFSRNPFLSAKSFRIGVKLIPLILSRDIQVTSVAIDEPQIALLRAPSGKWNFDSLGAKTSKKTPKTSDTEPSAAVKLTVEKLAINNGRIRIGETRAPAEARVYEDVNIEVKNFSPTSVFPFLARATAPGGGKLKMEGNAGPLSSSDMMRTPLQAKISIQSFDLSSDSAQPRSGLAGVLDYDGAIRSDGKTLTSEGKAKASKLRVVKDGAPASEPLVVDYASKVDLAQRRGVIQRGVVGFGASKANLVGTFDARGESILLDARLQAAKIPLRELNGALPAFGVMLPHGAKMESGEATFDLKLQGPVDRLVISGPIDVANAKLGGFNLKSRASAISALAGLPSASDLLVQALRSQLRVAPEGIQANGIELVLPSIGTVTGNGVIAANNSLNFKMRMRPLAGGSGGLVSGVTGLAALGKSSGEIPFLIQGTTSNPVFLPDIAGAAGNMAAPNAQGLQDLGGALGGFFGKKKKQ